MLRRLRQTNRKGYKYGGCHDNIAFGIKFSKKFLDKREMKLTNSADRKIVNLHNNDLGRKVGIIINTLFLQQNELPLYV